MKKVQFYLENFLLTFSKNNDKTWELMINLEGYTPVFYTLEGNIKEIIIDNDYKDYLEINFKNIKKYLLLKADGENILSDWYSENDDHIESFINYNFITDNDIQGDRLQDALNKVTYDLVKQIKPSVRFYLNEKYCLYHYSNGDSIVFSEIKTDKELFAIGIDKNNKNVIFEKL